MRQVMKTKLLQKLQRLQDAYSSLCGLTILMADHEGKQVTELSGLMDIIGLLLKVRNLPEKDTVAYMVEKIHPIDKPIVYESVRGFKLLVAPIRIKGQTLFYIFAGILVDESMKDLIAQKLFEDVPMHEWETWKRALQSTPTYDQDRMKVILQQIEELAEMIQALLEWDREEGNRASRLQLINLLSLMDRNDPNWLRGVLKVFVRVIELEFAGFACKTKGEQFTVTETIGFKGRESLQGATFFTGEGFFGQVGLTKQMGYWEKLDRDPRAAFFKTRGIKPKVIICYPIKYKDQLLGLLFGGHSSLEELSEELADMGALVANQLSADLYCFEMEGKNERRRIRIEALLEMTQGVVDVQEKRTLFPHGYRVVTTSPSSLFYLFGHEKVWRRWN
jgi:ligand-binding sensor protein